jgi:hypothetical protein
MTKSKKYSILIAVLTIVTSFAGAVGKSFITDPLGSTKSLLELFGASSLPDAAHKLIGSDTVQPQEVSPRVQSQPAKPLIGHGPNGPYLLPEGVLVDDPHSIISENYARTPYSKQSGK